MKCSESLAWELAMENVILHVTAHTLCSIAGNGDRKRMLQDSNSIYIYET